MEKMAKKRTPKIRQKRSGRYGRREKITKNRQFVMAISEKMPILRKIVKNTIY